MSDIKQELRDFEGSDALGNGDFSVCIRGADRIAKLETALQEIEYLDRPQVRGLPRRVTIQQIALDALQEKKNE